MTVDRQSPRRAADRLLSIEMASGNHAIVLNISNEGLGFHAINPVTQPGMIPFSFLDGGQRIEASGELVWLDSDKQNGGLRFDSLPQSSRERIRNWAAPLPAAALKPANTNVAPTPASQTKAPPSLRTAPAQANIAPPRDVLPPSAVASPGFPPLEGNPQRAGYFPYRDREYGEDQATSRSV